MNLLIVDDEYYSVEGIRQKLLSGGMEPGTIHAAYSAEQARSVFSEHRVDILLTDIEMPKQNGLELLEWVRNEGYATVVIIITSHANFDYASRALRLQSIEYLLKPVEGPQLLEAVARAAEQVRENESKDLQRLHAEYWNDSKLRHQEQFWKNLALKKLSTSRLLILNELSALHLPLEIADAVFYPVLLDCKRVQDAAGWEDSLYEYAVKNILLELLYEPDETPLILEVGNRLFLILIPKRDNLMPEGLLPGLNRAMQALTSSLPGIYHFFPAELCAIQTIGDVCDHLTEFARNIIYPENIVFTSSAFGVPALDFPGPAWEKWQELLLSQKITEVERSAYAYLDKMRQYPYFTRKELLSFHHDFLQLIYGFLEKNNAPAHQLFSDSRTEELSEAACDSTENMCAWLGHIITLTRVHLEAAAGSSDIVDQIKTYIAEHLAEELDRNSIAAAVYLSPDYVSHLFSDKEGMSLSGYITKTRMTLAKKLLYNRSFSIRDVALRSGFQNISYFSKQFKRHTGKTPQEFRRVQSSL